MPTSNLLASPLAPRIILLGFCSLLTNGALRAQKCLTPASGLVSWWAGEADATDSRGLNNASILGDARYRPGKVGYAFEFNGTGGLTVPDSPSLNLQALTISAWVYPTDLGTIHKIVLNKEPDAPGRGIDEIQYEIGIRGTQCAVGTCGSIPAGNYMFFLGGIQGLPNHFLGWIDGRGTIPLNTWTHLALTFDGTNATAYINGARTAAFSRLSGQLSSTSGPLRIGTRAVHRLPPGDAFQGKIDEVQLYNRALSSDEVQALYRAGASGHCRTLAGTVVNNASYSNPPVVAPDSIASLFGTMLAHERAEAIGGPALALGGVGLSLLDSRGAERQIPIFSTSLSQVNFLVPRETSLGEATLVATRTDGNVTEAKLLVERVAPGIYSANGNGLGVAAALALTATADGMRFLQPIFRLDSVLAQFVPSPVRLTTDGQVYLLLFGTGLRSAHALTVSVADQSLPVLGAAPQVEYPGLDQVNIGPLPAMLADHGELPIALVADGIPANIVTSSFR